MDSAANKNVLMSNEILPISDNELLEISPLWGWFTCKYIYFLNTYIISVSNKLI